MASPISFGDAYTMAKIAYRLGRAFTKGRKSAPAEFHEIENQLYALSTALEALKRATDKGDIRHGPTFDPNDDPIGIILASCNETLSHLDDLVKKYGSLSGTEEGSAKNEPAFTRIGKRIKRNWQTIRWTTEGGDIATLRSQLTLHTNSLGLILGVANGTRTATMSTQVSESTEILKDIYQWFLANLKNSELQKIGVPKKSEAGEKSVVIYFNLEGDGFECHRAALPLLDRSMDQLMDKQNILFECHCSQQGQTNVQLHADQVSTLTFSPSSFPVRLSGNPRSWIIYKMRNRDTHQLQNLTIRCLNLKHMSRFEERFVEQLAIRKARELLTQGTGTLMAHLSPESDNVRMLNSLADTSSTQFIDSVTFTSETRSFIQGAIASINLFHYKSMPVTGVVELVTNPKETSHDSHTELVIFYKKEDGNSNAIAKTVVYLEYSTVIKRLAAMGTTSSLKIGPANCVSFNSDEEEAAANFGLKLREMQVDLFATSHQYPRPDESLLLHLQADEISCEDLHIENGIIDIVVSQTNNRHRLILRSANSYAVLSQELPQDFMSSLKQGTRPDLSAPTDEIRMQEKDGAVYRQLRKRDGIKQLRIRVAATQNDRLLELGLATLTGGALLSDSCKH
ncbi:hypothetical protein KAF25_005399 [Fusarium avenaceum]|uniref:Fungal N-terminal domain-containing protein n=1 Tax=Fusarium avenaceum TaxID=40199 RepID=A0A9P7H1Y7_9HYPO|nr:hypothetical protein KAF25_005399 [Fusarium avenaceum]